MSPAPDPWSADTPALLAAGALTHVSTATITTTAGDTVAVPIVDGTLSYDDTRAPRVALDVTAHLIPDAALASRIDPRTGTRVQISLGYVRPNGTTDLQPVANLGLRTRTRTRPDDELAIAAASDEALVIDAAPTAQLTLSTGTTSAAITSLIQSVIPAAVVTVTLTSTGPAVDFDEPDVDKWTAINDLADRLNAAVYDDGTRAWFVDYRPNYAGTVMAALSDGPAGSIVEIEESWDRDTGWANKVQLVYGWQDSSGTDRRVVATGTAIAGGTTKTLDVRRDTPTTQAQANLAAANLVARTVTRGRAYTLTAPSCYWLRPGHTITVAETGQPTAPLLVSAVSFDLRTGLMSITARLPETADAWDQQPTTLTWNGVTATMTWDTFKTGG